MARRAGLRAAEALARWDRISAIKLVGIGPSYIRSSSVKVFAVIMGASRGCNLLNVTELDTLVNH